jgi:DNA-binding MarR family transcriptional regulator
MPDKPFLLDEFLPYRLSVLSNRLSAAIAESYSRRYGLSIPEWRVIAVLAHARGASAAGVAERTAMDKVAVSRAVRRLQQTGRVSRRMAAGDRRRSMLDLTAEGRRIYDRVTPALRRYEEALLTALDTREREALATLLQRLETRARQLPAPVID